MNKLEVRRYISARLFGGSRDSEWRVGTEIELIPLARRGSPGSPSETPDAPAILTLLRQVSIAHDWRETRTPHGIPAFAVPGTGRISFEPGGQVELSTHPYSSPSRLLAAVRTVIALLRSAAEGAGIDLLEIGLDPVNDVTDVPLVFPVERYTRMAAYFRSLGGDGLRMMKQTASCQVSVDARPDEVIDVWRVLNSITPFAIAAFANSPFSGGRPTGDASTRARIWQNTDNTRTGIFPGNRPAEEYCEFVLSARAFLHEQTPTATVRDLIAGGALGEADLEEHLTTLFPEVRPRGYLEFRACDMVGDDGRVALLVLVCAIARDFAARAAIAEITGKPDRHTYALAPGGGDRLLDVAADALQVAIASARRELPGFWERADIAGAERFLEDYTRRRRTPASDCDPVFLRSGYQSREVARTSPGRVPGRVPSSRS